MSYPLQLSILTIRFIQFFLQTCTFCCCFSVSATISTRTRIPGSIFPLSLRDIRLYPITHSTFLQAFAPTVINLRLSVHVVMKTYILHKIHYSMCNYTGTRNHVNYSKSVMPSGGIEQLKYIHRLYTCREGAALFRPSQKLVNVAGVISIVQLPRSFLVYLQSRVNYLGANLVKYYAF